MIRSAGLLVLSGCCAWFGAHGQAVDGTKSAPTESVLSRHYKEGEALAYHMSATNQGRTGTIRYEADANGTVKKNSSGHFTEEFLWTGLRFAGQPVPVSGDTGGFRQELSLDPTVPPSLPDFRHVDPRLIGPCADLLTFYADLWLAIKQEMLIKAGQHAYVKHGTPNSWADGRRTILGQDSIDFDITLPEVHRENGLAKLIVRHVPPAESQIKVPAKWMEAPVLDTPNNWVEVSKTDKTDYPYLGEIGKETFDVQISLDLRDGKILSAIMDNPVTVMARECEDVVLEHCGAPEHYEIRRQIEIRSAP